MKESKKEANKIWVPRKIKKEIHINTIYSFFKKEEKVGHVFSGESHDFWECLCVLNGAKDCMSVVADDRVYWIGEGDIVFHKPYELHKFQILSDCTIVVFSFNLYGRGVDFYKNKIFKLNLFQKNVIANMISYAEIISLHFQGEDNYHKYLAAFQRFPTYAQMINTYIYQLLLSLAESNLQIEPAKSDKSNLFRNVVEYMRENITANPMVDEIARHCDISTSTLKRIFAEYAGMSVHNYFLEMKLNEATKLLRAGKSVCDVAEVLGFSSQSYFSNLYKKKRNIQPSAVALIEK